jgi:hypothetical protein
VTAGDERQVIAFEAMGARAAVSVPTHELVAPVSERLPPGSRPCPPEPVDRRFALVRHVGGGYGIVADADTVLSDAALDRALDVLRSCLLGHVLVQAREVVFVHAGVVGYAGRAIVLPGASGTGKSTLVAALVRRGAAYYTDDFAPLDADGRVHPYPIPPWFRDEETGRTVEHPVSSLAGETGNEPLTVGIVASVRYAPGARWSPRTLTSGQAALTLLEYAVAPHLPPGLALAAARRAADDALVLAGERDDADEAAADLLATASRLARRGGRGATR